MLLAISAHGEANRQCWTWLSPFGTRLRLHYMITRRTDADHGKVKVDYRMPVGFVVFKITDRCLHEYARSLEVETTCGAAG